MLGDQSLSPSLSLSSSSSTMAIKPEQKELLLLNKNREYEMWIGSFLQEIQQTTSLPSSKVFSGSDSKDDLKKKKHAIIKLQQHLQQEMPELNDEQRKQFYDFSLSKIFDLMVGVAANNLNDIKSGIMLMCILLDTPSSDKIKPSICAPFANHLRNVNLNYADLELLDLVACAVGKIAVNSDSSTPNFVEFEIRRAIEVIGQSGNDRNDIQKRHSAILNLRELANVTPSYFFNHVTHIFENIFIAIYEPKLREPAISALRSALYVVVERERLASNISSTTSSKVRSRIDQQIPMCFELCYQEVIRCFEERDKQSKDRDYKIHAALLILNELFRCSHDTSKMFRMLINIIT